MMLGTYLKKKLTREKEVPATEQFYSPLRIALHSTIELQTVDILVAKSVLHPSWVLPDGQLEVLAIGTLDMDGTKIYQIYVQDLKEEEFILQLVEGKDFRSGDPKIDEITLYKQTVTLEPETEASLDRYLSNIGFEDIDLDEVMYERMWGDRFTEKADFRKYRERVITPNGPESFTNEWMLYGREIENPLGDDPITEFLLVGVEEGDDNAQIMMQLGLKLNPTDISVQ